MSSMIKFIMTENVAHQVVVKVPSEVLTITLGQKRAEQLMGPVTEDNKPCFNVAGANIYPHGNYSAGNETILISGHHKGEYKSTVDYLLTAWVVIKPGGTACGFGHDSTSAITDVRRNGTDKSLFRNGLRIILNSEDWDSATVNEELMVVKCSVEYYLAAKKDPTTNHAFLDGLVVLNDEE